LTDEGTEVESEEKVLEEKEEKEEMNASCSCGSSSAVVLCFGENVKCKSKCKAIHSSLIPPSSLFVERESLNSYILEFSPFLPFPFPLWSLLSSLDLRPIILSNCNIHIFASICAELDD